MPKHPWGWQNYARNEFSGRASLLLPLAALTGNCCALALTGEGRRAVRSRGDGAMGEMMEMGDE